MGGGDTLKPVRSHRRSATIGPHMTMHGDAGPSDEALVAGMASHDDAATVVFVRRFQRRVFGLAVGILADKSAAEDVAQEALVRAWTHAPVFDARRGSVESWLLTITRNLAIDALRKRRSTPTDPDVLVALAMASTGPSTEDLAAAGSISSHVSSALTQLSNEHRRAVLLASLYGRTAQEISDSERIPLGTAKTRIRAGLLRLRALLEGDERKSDDQ